MYQAVIDEVIESVREAALEEAIDEQVLSELKQVGLCVHFYIGT